MSNSPSWSARNATNLPSGEISAPSSAPSQFVSGVKVAPSIGFWGTGRQKATAHTMASATSAAAGQRHRDTIVADLPASALCASTPSSSIRQSPMSRSRFFGSLARQRRNRRRIGSGVASGSADQSGSRSRTLAMESDAVSPAKATRPVSISIQHASERPDVGALVHRQAARLFGAHVGGGADHQTTRVDRRRDRASEIRRRLGRDRPSWPGRSRAP